MQKHNLNAEYARIAPQFLAFLDREEKKLRAEMERLRGKQASTKERSRWRLRPQQPDTGTAENERTHERAQFSAENASPIGSTIILPPGEAVSAELPEYIRTLRSIQPAHVHQQTDDDESSALDDTIIIPPPYGANAQRSPRPTDAVPGLEFDE